MIELSELDIETIKAGLRSGHGFTKTASFIMVDVKDLSELYINDKSFKDMCDESVKSHVQAVLSSTQKRLLEKEFEKYVKENAHLSKFITKLTLWEEHSSKDKLTTDIFIKAIHLYIHPDEVATSCGLSRSEMYDYIKSNETLSDYVSRISWIT